MCIKSSAGFCTDGKKLARNATRYFEEGFNAHTHTTYFPDVSPPSWIPDPHSSSANLQLNFKLSLEGQGVVTHQEHKKWMRFFLHFHSWQFPHNSYGPDWVLGRERCRNCQAQKIELGNILKIYLQARRRNSQIHFKSQQCKFKGLNYSRISCV